MNSPEKSEDDAARWLARRDRGALNVDEEQEFQQWMDASTANRIAYLRVTAIWSRARRLQALTRPQEEAGTPPAYSTISRRRTGQWIAAASLVLLGVLGWNFWQNWQTAYRTEIGALQSVPLRDGSRITLNTNSEVRVDLSGPDRRAELRRGEVFFEIAPDAARPFHVIAGAVDVQVVGTQFAVYRTYDGARIMVSEGRVRVRRQWKSTQGPVTELSAGDEAWLSGSGIELRRVSSQQIENALAWRTGMLIFSETPLSEAVSELNRYHQQQLVIVDPALADVPIGGTFRTTNADAFVRLLQDGFGIQARSQSGVTLLSQN